jgi:hypothetical protein
MRFLLSERKDLQGIDPGGDRTYGQWWAELQWQPLREWSLSARYRFIGDRTDRDGREALSNAFMLSVSYRNEHVH